jgi:delta1-piperideine-2-carboxylate reductase
VDAHGGFAPLALTTGREKFIETTREQGVAVMALVHAHHFAALWIEIEPLATAGLCAMACTAYMPAMPPTGGKVPFFGTNPLAFGWPRKANAPMVFDLASAVMAKGEIMIAARDGYSVPPGVGLDSKGAETTDPKAILDGGMVLPFGGYKGANIAMMIELLAAGLIGERFSFEAGDADNKDGGPPRGGEFLLAIDPSRISGPNWLDHTEGFFERLLEIDGVRLPGSRRYENRDKFTESGITLPTGLYDRIIALINKSP